LRRRGRRRRDVPGRLDGYPRGRRVPRARRRARRPAAALKRPLGARSASPTPTRRCGLGALASLVTRAAPGSGSRRLGISGRGLSRDRDREDAALTGPVLDADLAAVRFDCLTHDREAEAEAALVRRVAGLDEGTEEILGRDLEPAAR